MFPSIPADSLNLPVFRLWNSLDNDALHRAMTEGLPLRALRPVQAQQFWCTYSPAQPTEGQGGVVGIGLKMSLEGGRLYGFSERTSRNAQPTATDDSSMSKDLLACEPQCPL